MSNISQLIGTSNGPISAIVNRFSDGGTNSGGNIGSNSPGKAYASGALTANTLATVLSVTGRGRVNWLCAFAADSTSRTIRLKVTVDGVSIFDATSSAITSPNLGIIAIGSGNDSAGYMMQPIDFNSSLLVQIASSLTETDKVTARVNYEVWS